MYVISATAGEVFTYIGYVIAAVLALMVMIVIHELGHYTAGKWLGFKIDEFANATKRRGNYSLGARFR